MTALDGDNRQASVDSAAFFEGDEYDGYDDYAVNKGAAKGGSGKSNTQKKDGSKGVYSAKHVRAKDALRQNAKTNPKK
jgi:hypothetical protein